MTTDRLALTSLMLRVLRYLASSWSKDEPYRGQTCNDIAHSLGFRSGQDPGKHSHSGRSMAPAQRIIFPIRGLRVRGLVTWGDRRDGLSGTAYRITDEGLAFVAKLDKEERSET